MKITFEKEFNDYVFTINEKLYIIKDGRSTWTRVRRKPKIKYPGFSIADNINGPPITMGKENK
jgi:hypothetical protein